MIGLSLPLNVTAWGSIECWKFQILSQVEIIFNWDSSEWISFKNIAELIQWVIALLLPPHVSLNFIEKYKNLIFPSIIIIGDIESNTQWVTLASYNNGIVWMTQKYGKPHYMYEGGNNLRFQGSRTNEWVSHSHINVLFITIFASSISLIKLRAMKPNKVASNWLKLKDHEGDSNCFDRLVVILININ